MKARPRFLSHDSSAVFLLLLIAGLAVCDLLTFYFPFAGQLGTALWMVSGTVLAFYGIHSAWLMAQRARAGKYRLTFLICSVWMAFLVYGSYLEKSVNFEFARCLSCALRQLQSDPAMGFHSECHLGYPARQYFLPALPSLLLGRTVFALHFGGILYFAIGLWIFAHGLTVYLDKHRQSDPIVALAIALLMHVHVFVYSLYETEQANFPASWALAFCGLFALYWKFRKKRELALLGLVVIYLGNGYTPALSLFLAALVVLVGLSVTPAYAADRRTLIALAVMAAIISAGAFTARHDLRALGDSSGKFFSPFFSGEAFRRAGETARALIRLPGLRDPAISYFIGPILLLTLSIPLYGALGWRWAAVSLWAWATIIAGAMLPGASIHSGNAALFRSTVTLPVLLSLLCVLLGRRFSHKAKLSPVAALALAGMIGYAVYFQIWVLRANPWNSRMLLLRELQSTIPPELWQRGFVLMAENLNVFSLEAELSYFEPAVVVKLLNPNCYAGDAYRYGLPILRLTGANEKCPSSESARLFGRVNLDENVFTVETW